MIFNLASLILKFDLMLLNGIFGSIIRKCYVATQHRHPHPTSALVRVF